MPKLDIEEVSRAGICAHEAGHAFMLHHYGIEIAHLKLEFSWWTGNLQGGYVQPAHQNGWTDELYEAYLVSYPAGEFAMLRFLLEAGMDSGPAHRMAEYSGSYDRPDLLQLLSEAEEIGVKDPLSESYARSRAEVLVDKYWGRIVEVGEQLNQRRKLAGRVVR